MRIVIIFGPPGVGKGTQAAMLAKKSNLIHFSTGETIREEIKKGTELGKTVDNIVKKGELISDDIIINMIEDKLSGNVNANGILFDGFPRTLNQAEMLELILEKKKIHDVKIINLTADNEELIKRLVNRGKIEGRHDDNEEVIKNRLEVYEKQTAPVIKFFKNKIKIININGIGEINVIQSNIMKALR
jgi:adenylate kinase